jgi:hypothetical protein
MIYRLRRGLAALILLGFAVATVAVVRGVAHFFLPYAMAADTLSAAINLLSTLVEGIASIIGITIAVLFITVQTSNRPNFTRALNELYSDKTVAVFVTFFFAALVGDVLSFSYLSRVLSADALWVLDLDVILSLSAILFLGPVILLQMENINPLLLAVKLCSRVTPRRIRAYQLATIEADASAHGRYLCTLNIWGQQHGLLDPLGAMHEVIMTAVESRDRVLLAGLNRTLLRRIARFAGVPYSTSNQPRTGWYWTAWRRIYITAHRPRRVEDQLAVALHLMHYMIRRAHNLRREWGDFDMLRQQYLVNIRDLIEALTERRETNQIIDLCLCAMLHIELGYGDIERPRNSRVEPLSAYFPLATSLAEKGNRDQATLCVTILGFLAARDKHLRVIDLEALVAGLPKDERLVYNTALSNATSSLDWFPTFSDPWHYLVTSYRMLQLPTPEQPPRVLPDLPLIGQMALALRSPISGIEWLDEVIRKARAYDQKEARRLKANRRDSS